MWFDITRPQWNKICCLNITSLFLHRSDFNSAAVLNKIHAFHTLRYKVCLQYFFFHFTCPYICLFISQTMPRSTRNSPAVYKMNWNTMSFCWHATAPCSPSTWLWYNVLTLQLWYISLNSPGVLVTKPISPICYFHPFLKVIKMQVFQYMWHSYLTGVTTCSDTFKIWVSFNGFNRLMYKMKKKCLWWNFSNPDPPNPQWPLLLT